MDLFLVAIAVLAGFKVGDWICGIIDMVEEGDSYNKPWMRYPHG